MRVEKCKWKYGKQAPVMFMIDDFANKYMTDKLDGDYVGADWGGRCKASNSLYEFLEEKIFREFPYVKMTLFMVVGRREALMENGKPSVSRRIDENPEFVAFLNELARDERFEVAYHGYTHGKLLGNKYLTQEWKTFASLEEACRTIEMSKDIYREVTGKEFYGGKYCGYESNEFSDESIVRSGFEWWCRHFDGNLFTHRELGPENLDLEEFQGVVDIPSTVDGGLTSLRDWRSLPSRAYLKAVYYRFKYGVTMEGILDELIQNGRIINIQEHSSPMREDDKHQRPNLVDDIGIIRYILRYLKKYDLWYATGHEIADYWRAYHYTDVVLVNDKVIIKAKKKEIIGNYIWVNLIEENKKHADYILISEMGDKIKPVKVNGYCSFEIKLEKERNKFLLFKC